MLASKAVGRDAATKKYDMLTALGTFALSRDKGTQRLVLRLMVLITARYNWRKDELSMGRKEIARIWAVNERTVKREMAKLKNLGWVKVKTPAARGRVAVYSINFKKISDGTQEVWASVGPDFDERMSLIYPQSEVKVVRVDFGAKTVEREKPETGDRGKWRAVRNALREADPDVFRNWYDKLAFKEYSDGNLVLTAPNTFIARHIETHLAHALMNLATNDFGDIRLMRIETIG